MVDLLALLAGLALGVLAAVALTGAFRRDPLRVAGPAPDHARPAPAGRAAPEAPAPAIRVNHPGATRPEARSAPPVAAPPPRPPAAGPRQATLTTSDGAQTVALGDEVVTMGRGTDQRLRIPDSRASRAHAVVRPRAKGGWEVKDVGSANGTLLNGHTIPEGRVAPLRDGDRIGIGPVTITYTEGDGGPPAGGLPPAGPDATEVL
ncbi:FHA domain-containing protein [Iamia majanohamensis]|uniref:FHA domain-containing protein n=1 Tax=Iamia majanohamensis TaxID=467976 RepID=A0AAE9YCQ1_9ACTN|nr:FHA domain-containing protein [Iamia majanohamensis]WCO68639.1 FHA domain-containing protein [Iamia majanohamensis]